MCTKGVASSALVPVRVTPVSSSRVTRSTRAAFAPEPYIALMRRAVGSLIGSTRTISAGEMHNNRDSNPGRCMVSMNSPLSTSPVLVSIAANPTRVDAEVDAPPATRSSATHNK